MVFAWRKFQLLTGPLSQFRIYVYIFLLLHEKLFGFSVFDFGKQYVKSALCSKILLATLDLHSLRAIWWTIEVFNIFPQPNERSPDGGSGNHLSANAVCYVSSLLFFSMLFVLLSNLARNVVLRVEGLILVFYHPNSVVEIHPPRVLFARIF